MADLGTLLTAVGTGKRAYAVVNWAPATGTIAMRNPIPYGGVRFKDTRLQSSATAGTLSGTVKEAGTPVANCVVRVYERASSFFIAETLTNAAGEFTFTGLRQGVGDYYVIALDPDGGTLYNALIFDRVAPV